MKKILLAIMLMFFVVLGFTQEKPKSWWEVGFNFTAPYPDGDAAFFEMHHTYPDAWIRFPITPVDPNGWLVGLNRNLDTGIFEKRNAIYPGVDTKGNEFLLSKFYAKKYGAIAIKSRVGQSQGTFSSMYAYNGFGDTAYIKQKLRTFIIGSTVNYYPVKFIGFGVGYALFYYYYKTWFTGDFTPLEISEPYKTSGWIAMPLQNFEIRIPIEDFIIGMETWQYIISVNDVKAENWYRGTISYRFGIKR